MTKAEGKTMKVNELMLGDLLTFKDCVGDPGFPILKVNGILPDTLFVQIDYSDADDEVDHEDVIGIPLTPEILEKNGWTLWEIEGEYKGVISIYGREAPFGVFDGIEINFVHQLQHALRLCGIDKTIEI